MSKTSPLLFALFIAVSLAAQESSNAASASDSATPTMQQQIDDLKARMNVEDQSIHQLQQQVLDRQQCLQELREQIAGLQGKPSQVDGTVVTVSAPGPGDLLAQFLQTLLAVEDLLL